MLDENPEDLAPWPLPVNPKYTQDLRVREEMATAGYVIESPTIGRGYFSGVGHATQRAPDPQHGGGIDARTALANARLWAAAPKMLPALRAMIELARYAPGGHGFAIDEAETICNHAVLPADR